MSHLAVNIAVPSVICNVGSTLLRGPVVKKTVQRYLQLFFPGDCYLQGGMKTVTIFLPISRFISQPIQDMAIVTMEDE